MTIQELLDLEVGDVARLDTKQMRSAVNKLKAAAKARAKRLEKYEKREGYTSPALKEWRGIEHREKYAKLNLNQLRNEFQKYSKFLRYKTSTITGTENYREHNKQVFGEEAENPDYMNLFDEFKSMYAAELEGVPSSIIISAFDYAYGTGTWKTKEELFEKAINNIRKTYSQYTQDLNEDFWDYENTPNNDVEDDILNNGF